MDLSRYLELLESVPPAMYRIIDSVNLAVGRIEEMQQVMAGTMSSALFDGMRNQIDQAVEAVNQLKESIRNSNSGNSGGSGNGGGNSNPPGWNSNTFDVFSGTGIERFQQEIQSANQMMGGLSDTQNRIARQAFQTNIFPPEAFQDFNSLAVRMDMLRDRIQQIESNPLELGTDRANAELEQLRMQLSQAVQEQNNLNSAVQNMDVSAANEAYQRLSRTIGSAEQQVRDNSNRRDNSGGAANEDSDGSDGVLGGIKEMAANIFTLENAKAVLALSDSITRANTKLSQMNDGLQSTSELNDMVYQSAQRSRTSYQSTVDIVSSLGQEAGDAFGSNEQTVQFAEVLSKQFVIAGVSQEEMVSASQELAQAMGTGTLSGEDINSIFGAAPNAIQTIADYLNVPVENIDKMASAGQITAGVVKNAMLGAASETDAQLGEIPMTWEQVWQMFENGATQAFQPLLLQINDIANSEDFQNFVNGVIQAIGVLANVISVVFGLVEKAGSFMADNWSVISPIIYGIAAALAVYYGWLILVEGVKLALKVLEAGEVVIKSLLAAGYMLLTGSTWAAATAQFSLNAAMNACPVVWIIILIIALIAVIFALCAWIAKTTGVASSAFGVICGALAVAGAFMFNLVVGVINGIIQFFWTYFVEPIIGIIEFVLNVMNGGFDDFGGAVANLIGNVISWFLSLGKVVTKIIDAIFGTSWTTELESLQDKVLSWGKNEEAITLERDAYQIDKRLEYGEAWDAGSKWGDNLSEKASEFDLKDLFKREEDGNPLEEEYNDSGLEDKLGSIAGDTSTIADNVETTQEDLEFLRDMAEREVIDRTVFSSISVNLGGINNTVNHMQDLDGVGEYIARSLQEQMAVAAEGVH